MEINILKVFLPSLFAFIVGIAITPILTNWLYKNEMWKKKAKTVSTIDGQGTPLFNKLHAEREVSTPRLGGIVIWMSALITIIFFWLIAKIIPTDTTSKFDFFSRSQTWIPLFTLISGAIIGAVDDWFDIKGIVGSNISGGLSLKKRLLLVGIISLIISLWFYFKLGISSVDIPWFGELNIGIFFIPLFILVTVGIYSGGVIDGLDGLAGGVFASMFTAYAGIAFFQNQIDIAAFCAVIVGAILAFLWFNIPPARFYMSETGSMALTITLAVIAFMTDSLGEGYGVSALLIIALPLVVTSLSVIIQVISKKFRKKKVFLIAPLHHHFEAKGWPAYKVTMRYWVVSLVCAILGMILALM
jgi:phospho-N-acetylmuramoyl-pentapeptide-transferase